MREGLACEAELARRGAVPARARVVEAATAFRYEHHLISRDELDEWLSRYALSHDEWLGWVRRSVARADNLGDVEGILARHAPVAKQVDEHLWAAAVCSGLLTDLARVLAAHAAVVEARGCADPPGDLERTFLEFCAGAATEEAVCATIELHRIDWLQIEATWLTLESVDTAAEAALCLAVDGESMAEVTARARVSGEERTIRLSELDPPLADRFLAADLGQVVGPVRSGSEWVVVAVRAKRPPDAEDPETRALARDDVVRRAVNRVVEDRVRWRNAL